MAKISLSEIIPGREPRFIGDVLEVSRVPCLGEELQAPIRGRWRFFTVVGVMHICNPHPEAYDASVKVERIKLPRRILQMLDKYGGRPGE